MKRLRPLDALLLALVVPIWGAWFLFQVYAEFANRTAWVPVNVAAARSATDYPIVTWVNPYWAGRGGLAVGDMLIRAGDEQFRGIGYLGFQARVREAAGESFRVPVTIERAGERREIVLDVGWRTSTFRRLWMIFTVLASGITGIVILLKAQGAPAARPLSLALLLGTLPFATEIFTHGSGNLPVGPRMQTFGLFTLVFIGSMLGAVLFLRAAQLIPERTARMGRRESWWPWLFAVPALLIWWSTVFGTPLSAERAWQAAVASAVAFALSVLVVLTRNFRGSGPRGRRQIKWVVYGFYISSLPLLLLWVLELLSLATPLVTDVLSLPLTVVLPICILIAVLRYDLFDIDRVISATTSYTILAIGLLAGVFTAVPRVAAAVGPPVGFDPSWGQLILSLCLAAVAVPAHRRLRPQIERLFFEERYRLERGVAELLHGLAECEGPEEVFRLTGERLDTLLRPDACVIYARSGEAYAPAFVRGKAVPVAFDGQSPLVTTLRLRTGPTAAERLRDRGGTAHLGPFDRAALETLGAAVVLPVRRATDLVAFACLGSKRSGDVYTSTDLVLLAGVAHAVSRELLRFDDAQIIREGRAMQEALRRYLPGPLVAQLSGGKSPQAGEREVSALFIDIRGFSTYSEGRKTEEVFTTSSRFAETVSRIVREHGGTVVEFSGDGMMALFGAPEGMARKERAAVEAGRDLVEATGLLRPEGEKGDRPLSVGVGIATGPAFVGDVQAVDHRIWTAIGNTINLAARLQALTRDLDAAIVVDAVTWRAAGYVAADFTRREQVLIRGLAQAQDIYMLPLGVAN